METIKNKGPFTIKGNSTEPVFIGVTKRDFLSTVAYWAVQLSPEIPPRNLDKVLKTLEQKIDATFKSPVSFNSDFKTFEIILSDEDKKSGDGFNSVMNFVKEYLMDIPEFVDWNLSIAEKEHGIDTNDDNRPKFVPVHGMTNPPKEHEVIDLIAFCQNVTGMLIKSFNQVNA